MKALNMPVLPWGPGLDVKRLDLLDLQPGLGLQKLVIMLNLMLNLRRKPACQGSIYRIQ